MKKLLMAITLGLSLAQNNLVAAENTFAENTKENLMKLGAGAAGTTLLIWGGWGMRHHLIAVYDVYAEIKKAVYEYTKNNPAIRKAAQYTLPLAALYSGYKLIQYSKSQKEKKEKKHFRIA